jgi:hypothetical protein
MWTEAGVAVCFGAVVLFVGGLASGMWLHMIREGHREAKEERPGDLRGFSGPLLTSTRESPLE